VVAVGGRGRPAGGGWPAVAGRGRSWPAVAGRRWPWRTWPVVAGWHLGDW